MKEIYSLWVTDEKKWVRLTPTETITDFKYFRDGDKLPKLNLVIDKKGELGDFIDIGIGNIYLISKKALDILNRNKVSGFTTYSFSVPTELKGLEDYKLLAIKGEVGPINHSLSKKKELKPIVPNGPTVTTYVGLFFDIDSWQGHDIFCPRGTTYIYCTSKIRDLLIESGVTNCLMKPIADLENFDLSMGLVSID